MNININIEAERKTMTQMTNNTEVKAEMPYRNDKLKQTQNIDLLYIDDDNLALIKNELSESREENPEENLGERSFYLSFSSEDPYERSFGIEILDHGEDCVDLSWLRSGRAPLLLDHDHKKQIGIIESAEITSDLRGRAKVRFGRSVLAQSVYQDVIDGIRGNISVGYKYKRSDLVLSEKGEEGKPDTYRVSKWEPLEVSLVSIPADQTVGIGRSDNARKSKKPKKSSKKPEQEISNNETNIIYKVRSDMEPNKTEAKITEASAMQASEMRTSAMQTLPMQALSNIDAGFNPEQIRQDETTRISEILALGDKHNMQERAMEFIKTGRTIDNFRRQILDTLSTSSAINTARQENPIIGMNHKEIGSFSIIKAIRAVISGNWRGAELEKEASETVSKQVGREPASFFVPLDIMAEQRSMQIRNLEKITNVAGGYLVGTDYMSGSFIELLRSKMLVKQMGAKVMSGLHGDVAIPKQTGGATTYWVSEGGAPDHSQQSFGQVTLSPRSIAAFTDFTRKLVLQSSPDIETLIRNDLATVIALEIDRVAISGSGNGAEPLGILNTDGIGEVAINADPAHADAISWGKIVDLESNIAAQNADIGTLGYLCNANMRGLLKQKEKANDTAQFIWENSGEQGFGMLNGYRVGTSNQVPANSLLFGNFGDLIIGQWGVMDVLVDPYTLGTSGGIRIRVMQDVDLAVRHAESFAVARA